ncbi:uncharacterized protein [Ptychodera flava]|uniref:uncharacterized protein n=1 Tax=Ptychodera flava TaxID=63121 RepID=UPI003969ED7E
MDISRSVWLSCIDKNLNNESLQRELNKIAEEGCTMHSFDDAGALITCNNESDTDKLEGRQRLFKAEKCDMTIWKVRADVMDEFSKVIEQLNPKKTRVLNNTGAVRKRKMPAGMYVEGSLLQVRKFEDTLACLYHERVTGNSSGMIVPSKLAGKKVKILENVTGEISPWVFYLCPSIEKHMDTVEKKAEVTIEKVPKKKIVKVFATTVDHLFETDTVMKSLASSTKHSPMSKSTKSGSEDKRPGYKRERKEDRTSDSLKGSSDNTHTATGESSPLRKRVSPQSQLGRHRSEKQNRDPRDISECLDRLSFSFKTKEDVKVCIKFGDITKEKADVIVNSANSHLQHKEGLAKVVADRAGSKVQRQCIEHVSKHGPLRPGQVCYTPGGNLGCKYLIHAVGPIWVEGEHLQAVSRCLNDTVMKTLDVASRTLGASSIVLPAISTGIHGVPVDVCARVYYTAISQFSSNHGSATLKDVRIVINDQDSVGTFILELSAAEERNRIGGPQHLLDLSPALVPKATGNSDRSWRSSPRTKTVRDSGSKAGATASSSGMSPHKSTVSKKYKHRGPFKSTMPISPADNTDAIAVSLDQRGSCQICTNDNATLMEMKCCENTMCHRCFSRHFQGDGKCPFCSIVVLLIRGNQPPGSMEHYLEKDRHLPGFDQVGTIVILYDFKDGFQGVNHPNPGELYLGTQRTAYLPANAEGREVLGLLKKAFDLGVLFTIGTSVTTGTDNCVVWNDVHHKTSRSGGPARYGYPDPTYLDRVKAELAAKAITGDMVSSFSSRH